MARFRNILVYRYWEVLDFLSKDLLPDDYLLAQIKEIAKKRFNRHEFWLGKNNECEDVCF